MPKRVFIDFESRSQASIWDCGAYKYAEDPTTEILCLAWAIEDGPVRGAVYGRELQAAIPELNRLIQEGAEFHAHNAYFERCVWRFKLTPKYGALPIPIRQWRCTAAKVGAHALPRRLMHAAAALGCSHQKDVEGNNLMRALCFTTGPIEEPRLRRLLEYCEQDVRTERDIDRAIPDLCPSEQEVWFMDQYLNDTGVCVDIEAVKNAVALVESETKAGNEELFRITGGLINAGTKREAIKKYLETKGLKLPNLQKGTVKDAITKTGGDNLRILQLRQQLSLTSNAKYNAFLAATSPDGRIRDLLVYHGASTGRWSGKLVQIQNLVKATLRPRDIGSAIEILKASPEGFSQCYDVLPTLSSCLRGMLIPSPGHTMFITDFAAIEARVVMWLAGEEKGTKLFHEQDLNPDLPDIYVHMARQIHHNNALTKKDKTERQLGKQAVLGAGFGMGPAKFQDTCEKYGVDLGPKTAQVETREGVVKVAPLAITSIQMYRSTFSKVPEFWYSLEAAAKRAILSGTPQTCGKIGFFMDGEFLRMKLPSGRTIVYHKPSVNAEGKISFWAVNSITNKYGIEYTWGGKLAENCLAKDTKVLTLDGVKDIIDVKQEDKVWDGENWVATSGVVNRGTKNTGRLGGFRVTPDHLIRVGNSWKQAAEITEDAWQDALKPGLSSVASACCAAGSEMTAKLYASVLAAVDTTSKRENSSEGESNAGNARVQKRPKNANGTRRSCLSNWPGCGCTATRGWYRAVLTPGLKRIRTTAGAVSGSIWFGFQTVRRFWSTRKRLMGGTNPIWTWTELKTIGGITREIFGSLPEKSVATIEELQKEYGFKIESGRLRNFGRSFALFGKATTLLFGILVKGGQPNRLWKDTGEQEVVYDLLNCGPNNRFTVISADGPIVVHNCTQGVARDIMVASMFAVIRAGYRLLFTVHDELVAEHKEGSTEEILRIVRTVPPWAKGCPINAESEQTRRYQK